jgi:hypothetical protein
LEPFKHLLQHSFDMFHKALSRVLAEIILIIVVLAGVAGAYFVYSTYFSASAYTVDAQVNGKLLVGDSGAGTLVVDIKNTGSYQINNMTVIAVNPSISGLTLPIVHSDPTASTDLALNPGKSMVVKFTLSGAAQGTTYNIVLQIKSNNGGSITKTITVLAM